MWLDPPDKPIHGIEPLIGWRTWGFLRPHYLTGTHSDYSDAVWRCKVIYKIQRTRLITEVFRVEADNEEDATDMLNECDTVCCRLGVEQIELSTVHSEIDFYDEVEVSK